MLFRCGAVWMRVEPAASRAAKVRDAPAASWRCQPTPCSAPDLVPWTTAPGFAFHPATARLPTASTTRSSRKVKVSVFCLQRPFGVIRMICTQGCRESTAVSLLEPGAKRDPGFPLLLLRTPFTPYLHCPVNVTTLAK